MVPQCIIALAHTAPHRGLICNCSPERLFEEDEEEEDDEEEEEEDDEEDDEIHCKNEMNCK